MWFQCRDTGVALPVAGGYGLFALPVADACQSRRVAIARHPGEMN